MPAETLSDDGVLRCLDQNGKLYRFPWQIGVYTVTLSIGNGEWATEEANKTYFGISADVTVEIVAAAEEEGAVEMG